MTSAPKSESTVAAAGPAMKLARSTTFRPENILSTAMHPPYVAFLRPVKKNGADAHILSTAIAVSKTLVYRPAEYAGSG
jgi:hypothetical protein